MNLLSIFKKKVLSPISLKALKEQIEFKQYFLERLNDPEYTKELVSRDNEPIESKIKFMINTTKYELYCLEQDFKNFFPKL